MLTTKVLRAVKPNCPLFYIYHPSNVLKIGYSLLERKDMCRCQHLDFFVGYRLLKHQKKVLYKITRGGENKNKKIILTTISIEIVRLVSCFAFMRSKEVVLFLCSLGQDASGRRNIADLTDSCVLSQTFQKKLRIN